MSIQRVWASFLAVAVLCAPVLSSVCPDGCICSTTRDGLHRAACSNLAELYKFTLRQKHHNINILDLSHNNITKISRELDRLTEVVTLDLSTNGITEISKFLNNAKKLVHLNLANNRIEKLSLTHLPTSVSSLDLTNNLLRDVPSNIAHLGSLEHLELEGNPLDCTCNNIRARDRLLASHVHIDAANCASPGKFKNRSWLELKTKDICKIPKVEFESLDMMMGDQPQLDAVRIGEETTQLKSMPLVAESDLYDGKVIHEQPEPEDDDNKQFMKVGHIPAASRSDYIEGSGDIESTTESEIIEARYIDDSNAEIHSTDDPIEGSGEGSGFIPFESSEDHETTTPLVEISTAYEEFRPNPITPASFDEDLHNTTEYPPMEPITLYTGGPDWYTKKDIAATEKAAITPLTRDTTVSEQIRITPSEVQPSTDDNPTTHKTGTYVCIAIIVILLVGLIGFAIIKGQMRKRRDRRLLRQQKRDVETASKEMVDMNKSLLGKPAALETPIERKVNGKYELVPTHEGYQKEGKKKSENGDIGNGIKHGDNNGMRTDSPRDTNQNKSSSKDNNLSEEPHQDNSFESTPACPDSRKDTHSLSSADVFVPINDDDAPHLNGNTDMDMSQLLLNGDQNTESDFLSPSREYVPVYSPDMGRVRIKMTETPKPKTPVFVTRSRSNAGDIIITPSLDENARKSTT